MSDPVGCSCSCHKAEMRLESRFGEAMNRMGGLLRDERVRCGISQRELADRVGVSASFISQLENGKTHPSLTTLIVVADELALPIDWLVKAERPNGGREPTGLWADAVSHHLSDSGTDDVWTQLDGTTGNTAFLCARLEARQFWPPDNHAVQHRGREYGYMLSGVMTIDVGSCRYTLQHGDSIAFDSTEAHRVENPGTEQAQAIWFILDSDPK